MADEWMPLLQIEMTIDKFHQLPRHPAYKYEYLRDKAVLSPQPKYYHALLRLDQWNTDPELQPTEELEIALVKDSDFEVVLKLFKSSVSRIQPFASLEGETLEKALHQALEKTWTGEDGPWLREASLVARTARDARVVGALFITLLPEGDASDYESYYWEEPPEEDVLANRQGRPHLTWIFVHPFQAGYGTGTALLASSADRLQKLGYSELYSTFVCGNESSMLWHWRNGFQLLSYPFSLRRMQYEIKRKFK